MMNLIDITLTLSEKLPTWPGDPKIKLKKISRIQDGADANVTALSMAVHAGTHIDAPHHFVDDGYSAEDIPLDLMVGPATVIELPVRETITRQDLEQAGIPAHSKRLLLKTPNSRLWEEKDYRFKEDFIALGADAAEYLVERGTTLVGVDYLSVAPFDNPAPTHQTLLKAGILIIESLNLSKVNAGDYSLLCLPLKIAGSDGAPARVLLMR
jgi:arylformamidase